jgi:predicted RNA-binding Zn-ribbon protein involved in translation (DUF1610 family)
MSELNQAYGMIIRKSNTNGQAQCPQCKSLNIYRFTPGDMMSGHKFACLDCSFHGSMTHPNANNNKGCPNCGSTKVSSFTNSYPETYVICANCKKQYESTTSQVYKHIEPVPPVAIGPAFAPAPEDKFKVKTYMHSLLL